MIFKFFTLVFIFSAIPYACAQIFPTKWVWIYATVLLMSACGLTFTPKEVGGIGPDFGYFFVLLGCWMGILGSIIRKIVDTLEISHTKKQIIKVMAFPLTILIMFGTL